MSDDIESLLKALENGGRDEVWEAAKQLESIAADVLGRLMSLLQHANSTETRSAAAYLLGFGRYSLARTNLEATLDDPREHPSVRGHAAEALGYIGSKDSVPILVKHLSDGDIGVKYWCIFALGQIKDIIAVPPLTTIAKSAHEAFYEKHSLRDEALDALAEIQRAGGSS